MDIIKKVLHKGFTYVYNQKTSKTQKWYIVESIVVGRYIMMKKGWNEDEIECGFLVTKERKKLWMIQLDLIEELLRVCEENDIKIFAVCGTLLGAVRHHGFIPWDDDVDFGVTRENYEKLIKLNDKFQEPYFLQHTLTDPYYYSDVARLRNSNTTAIEKKDRRSKCNNGVYVDIFPFDKIPENSVELQKLTRQTKFLKKFVYWPRNTSANNIKDIFKVYISKIVTCVIGYNRLYLYYQNICKSYNGNSKLKRVGIVSGSIDHSEFYYYVDDISETIKIPFENIFIPVPVGYDRCLKVNYGNYMEYPPIEERGKWHCGMLDIDTSIPYREYQIQKGWLSK